MLELLTESRAQTARRCLREEHLRYREGIVPVLSMVEALRIGTLGHHALEAWWRASRDERFERAMQAIEAFATPDSNPFELVAIEELIRGYDVRWGDEPLEAIGVELEFRAPLRNPDTGAASRTFQLAGKIDVLLRSQQRTLIMDHKFSGEEIGPGSVFWARLRMGGQSSGYIRGAEALGHPDVDGFIYDVIRKPSLRPHKATPVAERKYTQPKIDKKTGAVLEPPRLYAAQREQDETPAEYRERVREDIATSPDKYYQRATVVRLEEQLREHDRELWLLSQTLLATRRLGIAPRNTDACARYGSVCNYFSVCAGEDQLDSHRFTRLEWKHPELTPEGLNL